MPFLTSRWSSVHMNSQYTICLAWTCLTRLDGGSFPLYVQAWKFELSHHASSFKIPLRCHRLAEGGRKLPSRLSWDGRRFGTAAATTMQVSYKASKVFIVSLSTRGECLWSVSLFLLWTSTHVSMNIWDGKRSGTVAATTMHVSNPTTSWSSFAVHSWLRVSMYHMEA